ncbi:MAG: MarR family transcriptional regulator [Clostridia bacterium]|nr:MarR family transcriptional regulator [Clostridia bacterium]
MDTKGGFLISRVKRVGSRRFDRLLAESGIDAFNGAQGRILYVLWQGDDIPISALSAQTGLANTTLTSMLDRMEQSGLVQRVPARNDRRKINILLTDKAKALQGDYARISQEMNELYYIGFTEEEIRQFEGYLLRILDNLEGGTSHE